MTNPMIFRPTCPIDFRADDVTLPTKLSDGRLQYTCTASHGGAGPHTWTPDTDNWVLSPSPSAGGGEHNVTDDLLDPLMKVFTGEDRWLEYGVVEHRLRLLAPAVFIGHVRDASHFMFGSTETASKNRFSMALTRLANEGKLIRELWPSTGAAWKQTSPISYWSLPPAPPKDKTLTWADYCAELGRSDDWADEDRAGIWPPTQAAT
jgi:hypothetical protein